MKHPNPNLYPSSGWKYVHTDGEPFSSRSRDELVHRVAEYLLQKGEAGQAERLVDEYVCRKHPGICTEAPVPVPPLDASIEKSARMASNLARLVRRLLGATRPEAVLVPEQLILARAATCRSCPLNQQHRVTCGTCDRELVETAEKVAKISEVTAADTRDLKTCQHYDQFLPAFIRARNASADPSAPEQCWRRIS